MRVWLVGFFLVASCATEPRRKPAAQPEPEPPIGRAAPLPPATATAASPSSATAEGCIVVQGEYAGQPASVEGVLLLAKAEPGKPKMGSLVLRLSRPRCIVGLQRSSFVTEVYVSTTGPDLRPFVDTRVRITGDVLGGTNDLGGSAVVILAKDVARLEPAPSDP